MLTSSSRHRPDGQRSSGMGLHRRDLVPAPPALHGGVRRGKHLRHRRGHGPADAVHGQLDCMELGPEDGLVLRRRRPALHGRHVVSHSRDCSVSTAHCRIISKSWANLAVSDLVARLPSSTSCSSARSSPGASTRPRRRPSGSSSSRRNRSEGAHRWLLRREGWGPGVDVFRGLVAWD